MRRATKLLLACSVITATLGTVLLAKLILLGHSLENAEALYRYSPTRPLVRAVGEALLAALLAMALVLTPPRPAESRTGWSFTSAFWLVGLLIALVNLNRLSFVIVVASVIVPTARRASDGGIGRSRTCMALAAGAIVVAGSGSWMPTQVVFTVADDHERGYILRDDARGVLLLQRSPRGLVEVPPERITSDKRPFAGEICAPEDGDPLLSWSKPFIRLDLDGYERPLECYFN